MKTKSPRQIADQADNLLTGIMLKYWNGNDYDNKEYAISQMLKVRRICNNYIDRIFIHSNVNKWDSKGVDAIWDNPFKREIYFTPLSCESIF